MIVRRVALSSLALLTLLAPGVAAAQVDQEPDPRLDEAAQLVEVEYELLLELSTKVTAERRRQLVAELIAIDREGQALFAELAADRTVPPAVRAALGPLSDPDAIVTGIGPIAEPDAETYGSAAAALRNGLPTFPDLAGGSVPTVPIEATEYVTIAVKSPNANTRALGAIAAISITAMLVSAISGWERRRQERKELDQIAMADRLTGLANRRRLDADLDQYCRTDGLVSIAMVDIDHFKALNDRHGHVVGDDVLRIVAETIAANVRIGDVVYRYGGEEFCILLPDATEQEAAQVVDRVRCFVAELDFSDIGEAVTVSVGVSGGPAVRGRVSLEDADKALDLAKSRGRNRVVSRSERFAQLD